jgi:hypothetical protein
MKTTTTPKTANPKAHSNKMDTQTQMNTSEADGENMPVISTFTSQLQNLEWWYNAWSKIGVGMGVLAAVLALLAAAAGAVAYWYSLQMKPLQDELAQVKEDDLAVI